MAFGAHTSPEIKHIKYKLCITNKLTHTDFAYDTVPLNQIQKEPNCQTVI